MFSCLFYRIVVVLKRTRKNILSFGKRSLLSYLTILMILLYIFLKLCLVIWLNWNTFWKGFKHSLSFDRLMIDQLFPSKKIRSWRSLLKVPRSIIIVLSQRLINSSRGIIWWYWWFSILYRYYFLQFYTASSLFYPAIFGICWFIEIGWFLMSDSFVYWAFVLDYTFSMN